MHVPRARERIMVPPPGTAQRSPASRETASWSTSTRLTKVNRTQERKARAVGEPATQNALTGTATTPTRSGSARQTRAPFYADGARLCRELPERVGVVA